jgi:5,10-methylene-tetrahydrofolate dehydrogenase/methenyl tetrahydrofolate cyclohydrolase
LLHFGQKQGYTKQMILLNGKKLRDLTAKSLKDEVSQAIAETAVSAPQLVILQVGDLAESNAYITQKKLFGEKIGAKVTHKKFEDKISQDDIIKEIAILNEDKKVHGIILQLPIPQYLDKQKIIDTIHPSKDVDGLTATNVKLLWANDSRAIVPATVLGVISLLKHYEIPIAGKKATVIGRSTLVGKPLAMALMNENATVTVCHRNTVDLIAATREADIVISAAGSAHLVTKAHLRKGQTVVDVGINLVNSTVKVDLTYNALKPENEIPKKQMVGDVDFENVNDIVTAISPVPGGVGPMTVASLFQNLIKSWKSSI